MDIEKAFEEFIEKEWHDGHEPQGIDDQYVEEMEDEETEIDEASIYSIKNTKTGQRYSVSKYKDDKKLDKIRKAGGDHKHAAHYKDGKLIEEDEAYGGTKKWKKGQKKMKKAGIELHKKDRFSGYVEDAEIDEDYDKNQLLRVQHDEKLIAEAGDICGLDRADLRSKSMQKVYDKKCSPEMIKKKKSIFGKIAKGLKLYNQNSIGEEKMEKNLIDTVRNVLMGEAESGDKEAYQKFFNKALKKFKIDSPADLKDDEAKKKFYDYIDKNWKGDHEEEKEVETKKKVTESAALQLKMAFDDAKIKIKGTKGGKLVIDKKDEKKVEKIIAKQMKKPADAKRVLGSQIVFEDETVSKLFSHVRNLMSK